MPITHGMSVEEVRRLGRDLQTNAATVSDLVATVDRLVMGTSWLGPDADRFKHQWWPSHRAELKKMAGALGDAGRLALDNAGQQEDASEAGSGGAAGPGVPFPGWLSPMPDWARPSIGWWDPERGGWIGVDGAPTGGSGSWDRLLSFGIVDITEGVGIIHALAGAADDTRSVYQAVMVGLADRGMAVSVPGSDAWEFFRGAKGGHMAAYGPHLKFPAVSAGISGANYLANAYEYGWGSSEAAVAAVDGTLSTAASFVPGGGLVYEGSKFAGSWLAENTGLGDDVMANSMAADIDRDINSLIGQQTLARRAGDTGEVMRLQAEMNDLADKGIRESSGWKGLWNATVATGGGLVSWINPFD